jgi:hypothetical protein
MRAAAVTLLLLAVAGGAAAQETRAGAIAAQQEEKAENLHPYQPPAAEAIMIRVQNALTGAPDGVFPYFGSVYSGGGFTLGAGYRKYIGDNTHWETRGLYSIKNYKNIEVGVGSLGHARRRLDASVYAGYRDATQVAYYGLGIDTAPDARANFRMKQTYVNGAVSFRPIPWALLRGGAGYEGFSTEAGQGRAPSIEQTYTNQSAPGLGATPSYTHLEGTAAIDWRTSPAYSRRGGYYGITLHDFVDADDVSSFKLIELDLVQHLPILRENWVVSLHGRLQSEIGDGHVPFFLMPSLGSGSTLRGYRSWRFRDRHAALMSAEWRWIPSRLGLDMALFYDAGTVAPERGQLDFNNLTTNWGIGSRFHTPLATVLRIELARGSEGFVLVFGASAAF